VYLLTLSNQKYLTVSQSIKLGFPRFCLMNSDMDRQLEITS
jgi:hypothetical protein